MNMYSFDLFVCVAALDPAPASATASASAVSMATTLSPYLPLPACGSGSANVFIFLCCFGCFCCFWHCCLIILNASLELLCLHLHGPLDSCSRLRDSLSLSLFRPDCGLTTGPKRGFNFCRVVVPYLAWPQPQKETPKTRTKRGTGHESSAREVKAKPQNAPWGHA